MICAAITLSIGVLAGIVLRLIAWRITRAEREDIYDADPWSDRPAMPPFSGDVSNWLGDLPKLPKEALADPRPERCGQ